LWCRFRLEGDEKGVRRTLHQITRSDYDRLFGLNDVALGRLRNFAKTHSCVASFADHAILFRKTPRSSQKPVSL
jgi:hypothetical protein